MDTRECIIKTLKTLDKAKHMDHSTASEFSADFNMAMSFLGAMASGQLSVIETNELTKLQADIVKLTAELNQKLNVVDNKAVKTVNTKVIDK